MNCIEEVNGSAARIAPREGSIADVIEGRAEWAITSGDALEFLEFLPPACADAVWCDPPYCSGGFLESAKRRARGMLQAETIKRIGWFVNDNMGTTGLVWLLRSVAVRAARVLRASGHFGCFTDHRMIDALKPALESSGLRYSNLLVWDKLTPGLGKGFRAQHEVVLHFVNRAPEYHAGDEGNIHSVRRVPPKKKNHQTPKPPELVARHLRVVAPRGGLVVDPFVGGGGIGVAALRVGARFIGCDIDPGICEDARAAMREEAAALATRGSNQEARGRSSFAQG
ncbi:site-specific DNA-methyltransferase [Polyangium sp. y55x31]|uniref:DNA-methyltransferase n=1 Tax=Polyangium sp. y55x31 TaxID=3042688 RepID=UPI00248317C8|nr:site-specific DNA-methyltransferase [Polyangium sp. y55x31]MDI1475400.1 site-specific DNA-methyltransferase [Polyangium sp. y55x31]